MFRIKKLFFALLSFFIGLSFPNALTLTTDYQSNYFSNRIINDVNYSGPLAYMYIDNNIVYCLNPEVIVGSDYHLNQGYLSHYTYEQLEYLQLLAYYGYNDVNHTLNYYVATQELIWRTLTMNSDFYWSTERNLGGKLIDISHEMYEIRSNALSFYDGVSFKNETYYGYVGDEFVIEDTNNVLKNYIVEEGAKNYVYIEGNKLHIKVNNVGLEEIKLIRKINNGVNTEVYSSNGHQNLIRLGINVYTENYVKIKGFENPDISNNPDSPKEEPETPVDPNPPKEEPETPVDPKPPKEEPETPVDPNTPKEEPETPVDPDSPKEEPETPVDPNPPKEEPETPVDPDSPKEEPETPVDPDPPKEEPETPVDPDSPKEEPETPVDLNPPKEEPETPVDIEILGTPIYNNPSVEDDTFVLEDKLPNTYNSEVIYYIIFGINLVLGIGVYNKGL